MRTKRIIAGTPEELAVAKSTRKRRLAFIVALAILIATLSLVGKRRLFKIYQMSRIRTELQMEIKRLRQVNGELAQEIQAFARYPSRVEAIAREDLGLVKPGEIVYQFRSPGPGTTPPRALPLS